MENNGSLKRRAIAACCALIAGCALPARVFDYEASAHAALTAAILAHHAAHAPERAVPAEHRFDVIRGAQEEDGDMRYRYHFYDPVHARGLTVAGESFMSAKAWANAPAQARSGGLFTWDEGIAAYAAGDKRRAFLILGHALHLLEDMGVPEHVRNDAHILHSPYEEYTRRLTPAIPARPPIALPDRDAYFESLAAYTNRHFYSSETIYGGYASPKADSFVVGDNGIAYGMRTNEHGESYHVVAKEPGFAWFLDSFYDVRDERVLADYWRLLSAATIRHGSGLVALFIAEGEARAAERAAREDASFAARARSAVASAISAVAGMNAGELGWQEADVIDLNAPRVQPPEASAPPRAASAPSVQPARAAKTPRAAPPTLCSFPRLGATARGPVRINEVAWMGSRQSANDEWIELANVDTRDAPLAGYQVVSKSGAVGIVLPQNARIPAKGFYLLERTDDASVPGVAADAVYKGALGNENDGVALLNSSCAALDAVSGNPDWPAGSASARRTMERGDDLGWHDYSGAESGGVLGTPKAQNSVPAIRPGSAGGGGSAQIPAAPAPPAAPQSVSAPAAAPQADFAGAVLVNEFLFDAAGSDEGKEFIELHNATQTAIDISSWSLQVRSAASGSISKKNFGSGASIAPGACYLAWLGSPPPGERADFTWASGSLPNAGGSIYISQGTEVVSGQDDPALVDGVSYHPDALPGFSPGMSAERGESGALHARPNPSPGSCARLSPADYPTAANSAVSPDTTPGAAFAAGTLFARNIAFTHDAAFNPAVRLEWSRYPIIAGAADRWKAIGVFVNSDPPAEDYPDTDRQFAPASNAYAAARYPVYCAGCAPVSNLIVLPDTAAQYGSDGGLHNMAYNYAKLMADGFMTAALQYAPQKGDYITLGYYDFNTSGGGSQSFRMIFADPTRYYWK